MRITIQVKLSFEWDERIANYVDDVDKDYSFDVDATVIADCDYWEQTSLEPAEWYVENMLLLLNGIEAPVELLTSEHDEIINELFWEAYHEEK